MSGAGKTTVGKALSYKLKMAFLDMDDFIEKKQNMSISEIFERYGEEYFRNLEKQVAKEVGSLNGKVIATGGGIVKNISNHFALKQNGKMYLVNRE